MGSCPSPFLPGPGPPHIQVPGTHLTLPPWCPSENGNGISGVRITVPPSLWHCPVVQFLRALLHWALDPHPQLCSRSSSRPTFQMGNGRERRLLLIQECFLLSCAALLTTVLLVGGVVSTQPLIQMPRLRHRPSEGRRDLVISTDRRPWFYPFARFQKFVEVSPGPQIPPGFIHC